MSIQDWAAIGEIISAVAVVVSVLYVGIQVRSNTREIRAANRQQLVNRAHLGVMRVSTNAELAKLFASAASGAVLSQSEQTQYGYAVRGVLYDIQEAYLLYHEGGLDEGYWNTRAASILAYLSEKSAHEIYSEDKEKGILHPDFVDWLDAAIQSRKPN